jgi:hypothetical protein
VKWTTDDVGDSAYAKNEAINAAHDAKRVFGKNPDQSSVG